MEAHLAEGFVEFGQSGRCYSRADLLDLEVGHYSAVLPLQDLTLRPLGERHVLLMFESEMNGIRANRSSIGEGTESGWLMEFHQGASISGIS